MYTGEATENLEVICVAFLESVFLVYSSLEEHHKQDEFCKKIPENRVSSEGFCIVARPNEIYGVSFEAPTLYV